MKKEIQVICAGTLYGTRDTVARAMNLAWAACPTEEVQAGRVIFRKAGSRKSVQSRIDWTGTKRAKAVAMALGVTER